MQQPVLPMIAVDAVARGRPPFTENIPFRRARRLVLGALLTASTVLPAQSGAGYDVRWSTLTSGAGTMTGANGYSLNGAVSAPGSNAAGVTNSAGNYALRGGFWSGVHESSDAIFRNNFE